MKNKNLSKSLVKNYKMAQYIDNANQEILWKTFHKIPRVSELDYSQKEFVFKNAISTVYHTINPSIRLNKEQLQDLNKQTMTLLLEHALQNNNSVYESPEEITQRNFENKQKQYDKMTEKIVVPKPSELFQEPNHNEEGAILNMDERIEEFQKQRERDLPKFDAPLKEENSLELLKVSISNLEHRLAVLENLINNKK